MTLPAFGIRDARSADTGAITALLEGARLPTAGIRQARLIVAEHSGHIIGCAGLEVHGDAGLLRSVAVDAAWRSRGVGAALVAAIIKEASLHGLTSLVLLTTTASAWFPRFGFAETTREAVPPALLASPEFTGACPDTATVMRASVTLQG